MRVVCGSKSVANLSTSFTSAVPSFQFSRAGISGVTPCSLDESACVPCKRRVLASPDDVRVAVGGCEMERGRAR